MVPVESFHGMVKTVHLLPWNGRNFESFHRVDGNYHDSVVSNPGRTKQIDEKYINCIHNYGLNIQMEDRPTQIFGVYPRTPWKNQMSGCLMLW
jgi:hypothetical protein